MKRHQIKPRYGFGEEVANSVSHGIGFLLAVAGLVFMIVKSVRYGTAWHVTSCSIYGASMILLYAASTLYHAVPGSAKNVLQIFDHSAIFLLIAGTYTPFTLVPLRGPLGWSLFGLIWAMAVFGFITQVTPLRAHKSLSIGLYVGMGWAVVAATRPLFASVGTEGLLLLLFGGLAYTSGIVFYLNRRIPYGHAVWHLFVVAGSLFHFFAIYRSVIPSA